MVSALEDDNENGDNDSDDNNPMMIMTMLTMLTCVGGNLSRCATVALFVASRAPAGASFPDGMSVQQEIRRSLPKTEVRRFIILRNNMFMLLKN